MPTNKRDRKKWINRAENVAERKCFEIKPFSGHYIDPFFDILFFGFT